MTSTVEATSTPRAQRLRSMRSCVGLLGRSKGPLNLRNSPSGLAPTTSGWLSAGGRSVRLLLGDPGHRAHRDARDLPQAFDAISLDPSVEPHRVATRVWTGDERDARAAQPPLLNGFYPVAHLYRTAE